MSLFLQRPLFYAARVPASIAGFGRHCSGIGPTLVPSIWQSGRFVFRTRLGHAGRFSAPEVAVCTISCKKKVFEKQPNCACTLTATTWLGCGLDPPATFVAQMFRMKSAHALCRRRGGIPEASRQVRVEGSGTSTAPQDPAPGRQQYGRSRRCP
jgi:hypothetical protein